MIKISNYIIEISFDLEDSDRKISIIMEAKNKEKFLSIIEEIKKNDVEEIIKNVIYKKMDYLPDQYGLIGENTIDGVTCQIYLEKNEG